MYLNLTLYQTRPEYDIHMRIQDALHMYLHRHTQPRHLEYQDIIRPLHTHTHTHTHTQALLELSSSYMIGHTTRINTHTQIFCLSFLQAVNRRNEIKEDRGTNRIATHTHTHTHTHTPASRKQEERDQRGSSRGFGAACARSIQKYKYMYMQEVV